MDNSSSLHTNSCPLKIFRYAKLIFNDTLSTYPIQALDHSTEKKRKKKDWRQDPE